MNLTPDVDKFIPYSTLEWMDRCQMWIHGTYLYLTVRMGTCSYEYSTLQRFITRNTILPYDASPWVISPLFQPLVSIGDHRL